MDEVFVAARLVKVFVNDLAFADRHGGEAAASHRDPAPCEVVPHHDLGPNPNLADATESRRPEIQENRIKYFYSFRFLILPT